MSTAIWLLVAGVIITAAVYILVFRKADPNLTSEGGGGSGESGMDEKPHDTNMT